MEKRIQRLVREALPLQRECEALEKVKEQNDNMDTWFRNVPQEEACFARWYAFLERDEADS